jgi:4-amino-4-deoxy-L-arabinose transferase-like glycosyltransferase
LGGYGFSFDQEWWPITAAGAPTAHWSFLYTLYLVLVYAIFGTHPLAARILQAVLVGVLQPLIVYRLGNRVFGNTVGLIAALLTAVYAYFIYYSASLMTEPFYITTILAALYLAIGFDPKSTQFQGKKYAAYLGVCLGITILLRQLFLIMIPFLFLWMLWVGHREWRKAIANLLIAGAMIAGMILPFTAYNYQRFGRFVLLNTNSGYAFFWGNHPIYGTHFISILPPGMGTYQELIPTELRQLDEAALDQALLKRGVQFVLDDPIRYGLLSISRIPAYFMFWPSSDSEPISNLSRVLSFGLLWPFMAYGLIRALFKPRQSRRISSPIFLLVMFVILYTGIHLLSWALIRYRLPVDAVMLLFAGLAINDLIQVFTPRRIPVPIHR